MPMARQRARSSFIFEIKRTDRRTTKVVTLEKTPSTSSPSLVDQVFGKFPTKPDRQHTSGSEHSSVELPIAVVSTGPVATAPETPRVRRVLPDLLSTLLDPVEQRIAREAEERAKRRTPRPSPKVTLRDQSTIIPEAGRNPAVVTDADKLEQSKVIAARRNIAQPPTRIEPPGNAIKSGTRQRKRLRVAAVQAERMGRPLPRLPAGQRWKRRLPPTCW